jgi:hypothetical protein
MFTLGRKVDIKYATNRLILVFSLIIGVIGYFITGAFSSGLSLAGGTFLTWALVREVDPKHEYAAFLGAALSLTNLFYFERLNLLAIFWILLLLRMVSEICGKKLTLLDFILVFGFSAYLSVSNENSIYLIPFIIALSSLMVFKEQIKISFAFLAVSVAIFLIESFYFNYLSIADPGVSTELNIVIISVLILFPFFIHFVSINGVMDDKGNPAHSVKMKLSQMLFPVIVLLLYLFVGIGLNNLIIYLSVITGVTVYSLINRK